MTWSWVSFTWKSKGSDQPLSEGWVHSWWLGGFWGRLLKCTAQISYQNWRIYSPCYWECWWKKDFSCQFLIALANGHAPSGGCLHLMTDLYGGLKAWTALKSPHTWQHFPQGSWRPSLQLHCSQTSPSTQSGFFSFLFPRIFTNNLLVHEFSLRSQLPAEFNR